VLSANRRFLNGMVIMMGSLLEFSSGTLDLLPMVWVHMNALVVESMDNGLYHGKQLITL